MSDVLVLYFSRNGATEALAREVCQGVDSVPGMASRLRTVAPVSAVTEATQSAIPDSGPPYVTTQDLKECAGIVMGSPTRFGNMGAALKYFLDSTGSDWIKGTLSGKPAGVFTSTSSLHGGSESTLLTMAIPLLHHGMILVGLPYSEEDLAATTTGGSLYGATHVTWNRDPDELSAEEKRLAIALGKRVADVARRLAIST
ncbi:MAG: NAD(P)H:quinone oxidoreductase [Proteobacteria bacterium]|nr:NAD(P)H:quinone oxidoreductase [Pseudomonadota bacterium]